MMSGGGSAAPGRVWWRGGWAGVLVGGAGKGEAGKGVRNEWHLIKGRFQDQMQQLAERN